MPRGRRAMRDHAACKASLARQARMARPVLMVRLGLMANPVLKGRKDRPALGLATANLDSQLADLPTASENATAVWGNATRTLTESSGGGATAEDVWTYATRSLTEAPDVPTVEEIAAEVRTELTPELSRVANCATVESTGDQLAGFSRSRDFMLTTYQHGRTTWRFITHSSTTRSLSRSDDLGCCTRSRRPPRRVADGTRQMVRRP